LGDEGKRKQYDQFGGDGSNPNFGGASGFNWQDFAQGGFQQGNVNFDFGDLGDVFGDFFGGGSRGGQRRSYRGEDVEARLDLDFREAVYGASKKLSLNLQNPCEHCNATGGEPGAELKTCETCKGTGQIVSIKKTFIGNVQTASVCNICDGRGKSYSKKCGQCGGNGRKSGIRSITVEVPAGIEDGTTIKLMGQGNAGSFQNQSGDLYLVVRVKADPFFKRHASTVYSTEKIPYSTAVLGGKIEVKTIDGTESLKIPAGTLSETVFTIKNAGAPRFQKSGRGDQEVTVEIEVPKDLNKEQREAMKKLEEAGL
jgi:molecular chaperone DnaJ